MVSGTARGEEDAGRNGQRCSWLAKQGQDEGTHGGKEPEATPFRGKRCRFTSQNKRDPT